MIPKLTRTCWRFRLAACALRRGTDGHQRVGRFRRAFSESASPLVVAGQDFGKALGMLLRPQLQQLPLAVIDEVIVRAGTISTLVRLFWRIGCAGDGEITRISFLGNDL